MHSTQRSNGMRLQQSVEQGFIPFDIPASREGTVQLLRGIKITTSNTSYGNLLRVLDSHPLLARHLKGPMQNPIGVKPKSSERGNSVNGHLRLCWNLQGGKNDQGGG